MIGGTPALAVPQGDWLGSLHCPFTDSRMNGVAVPPAPVLEPAA
jgi:hypothetical protein